jgi:hypothetical protein
MSNIYLESIVDITDINNDLFKSKRINLQIPLNLSQLNNLNKDSDIFKIIYEHLKSSEQ